MAGDGGTRFPGTHVFKLSLTFFTPVPKLDSYALLLHVIEANLQFNGFATAAASFFWDDHVSNSIYRLGCCIHSFALMS